jgi:hypothetical protein
VDVLAAIPPFDPKKKTPFFTITKLWLLKATPFGAPPDQESDAAVDDTITRLILSIVIKNTAPLKATLEPLPPEL